MGYLVLFFSMNYNNQYIYVAMNSIPSYEISPWTRNPNTPSSQDFVFKIARTPMPSAQPVANGLGHIGVC